MRKILGFVLAVFLSGAMMCFAQEKDSAPDAQRLKQLLADFEEYAQKAMGKWRIPGMAVGIVQNDSLPEVL